MVRFVVMMMIVEDSVVIMIAFEDAPSIFFFHTCGLRVELLEDQMKIIGPKQFDQKCFDNNIYKSTIESFILK